MRRSAFVAAVLALIAGGCGTEEKSPYIAGFEPPAAKEGMKRYVLPPVRDIQPGMDEMWCQYMTPPAETDMDVLMVDGHQSKGGHHVVLYGTKIPGKVGDDPVICKNSDQLGLTFLGGAGGEGVGAIISNLPPGVTFRLPKGYALMANVHYVNTGSAPMEAQSVLDVKLAPPSADRKPLGLFANVALDLDVKANTRTTKNVYCTIQKDLDILLFFNHQHERGIGVHTDIKRVGEDLPTMIRSDAPWKKESIFAPEFAKFDLEGSNVLKLKKGDQIRTRCEWENTENHDMKFPEEMCVGTFIYLGDTTNGAPQMACTDGEWLDKT